MNEERVVAHAKRPVRGGDQLCGTFRGMCHTEAGSVLVTLLYAAWLLMTAVALLMVTVGLAHACLCILGSACNKNLAAAAAAVWTQ